MLALPADWSAQGPHQTPMARALARFRPPPGRLDLVLVILTSPHEELEHLGRYYCRIKQAPGEHPELFRARIMATLDPDEL